MTAQRQELSVMTSQERLDAYKLITDGCSHIWSKGKFQEEKAQKVLDVLVPLTVRDPFFLAHLTSYAMKNSKAKDLRVFLAYVAGLSSADGQPFSPGSKYVKPNLRYVGAAALQMLEPKLADRVALLGTRKFKVEGILSEATHLPTTMREALKKYLKYREANPEMLEGIRKAGLKTTMQRMARKMHYDFSDEAREILDWPRKGQKFDKRAPLFENLTDLQVAEKVRSERIPYIGVLAELAKVDKKVSPVVAVAMLEQATGNQAVIMRSTFEDAGILNDPEVKTLYEEKIKEAQTALDRVDHITKEASESVKQALKSAKSEARKEELGNIGKVFVHLDFSGSMERVREYAGERGAIIAEMVQNPTENFAWGWFSGHGIRLPLPQAFEADAFKAVLFGQGDWGGTDCFALYEEARRFGADVDVLITDQGHGAGSMADRIRRFHEQNPSIPKPKACVIVHYNNGWGGGMEDGEVKRGYEANDIPVAVMKPEALTETAVVTQAVKTAMMGPVAMVDEIMATELLSLPKYYYTI